MYYAADLEADALEDESTKLHCFGFKPLNIIQDTMEDTPYNKDLIYVFCRVEELEAEWKEKFENDGVIFFPLDKAINLLMSPKTTGVVWHNCLTFDFPMIKKFYGLEFDYDSFNGRRKDFEIIDTLVWSRFLNPERRLPFGCPTSVKNIETGKMEKITIHGLEAYGYKLGIAKPTIHDWSGKPLHVYVNRVIEDCKIQEGVYWLLNKEKEDVAITNGDKKGDWDLPLRMAHKTSWLMDKQKRDGVLFDKEGAEKLLIVIDKEMEEIEKIVEPSLGERQLPKGKQPGGGKPPKQPWKKAFDYNNPFTKGGKLRKNVINYISKITVFSDGVDSYENYIRSMYNKIEIEGNIIFENKIEELLPKHPSLLSASAISYCNKFDITDPFKMVEEFKRLDLGYEPRVLVEKLKLEHDRDVKKFLVREGWLPSIFKPRNILIDKKTKKKLSTEEVDTKLDKYINEFKDSEYWPFILKSLGYSKKSIVDVNSQTFRDKCIKKGRELISSPQYKDLAGIRCPNLKKLTGENSKLIIRWLSLKNRRSTIKSKKKETGWLYNKRLKVDGKLPASYSGVTPTYRKRHAVVVNVPKPKDHVVLGKEMRGLFIAPEGYYNVGGDGASIEALVASHYTIPFDNGKYAEGVLSGTFHDDNAKAYSSLIGREINRDDGKNFTYMILYGGSGKRAAAMGGVSEKIGKQIVDSFWEINDGLRLLKESINRYWERTGKKYVFGLDGRKVFTRSAHSLMNSQFQHAGALILDYAQCYVYDKMTQGNYDFSRWGEFHDESQAYENKNEVDIYYFDDKPEQMRDGKLYSKPKQLEDSRWIQYYAPFGHYLDEGFREASKYFKTRVTFTAEYMVGNSWRECH